VTDNLLKSAEAAQRLVLSILKPRNRTRIIAIFVVTVASINANFS
jgi:hypothetical protein